MDAVAELGPVFPGATPKNLDAAAARFGFALNHEHRPIGSVRGPIQLAQIEHLLSALSLQTPDEALLAYCLSVMLTQGDLSVYARLLCEGAYEVQLLQQQASGKRVHKGHTLFQLGTIFSSLGDRDGAFRFFGLAHLEDCVEHQSDQGRKGGAAYSTLRTRYGVREKQFRRLWTAIDDLLGKPTKTIHEQLAGRYAEVLYLLTWLDAQIVAPLSRTTTELPNWTLLAELLPIAKNDISGRSAELWLAAYLFGTAAFEVRTNVWTDTREYEFDVLIASAVDHAQLASTIGAYFAAEAKNWADSVGVAQVNHFASKLMFHDVGLGVLLAKKNVSGSGEIAYKNARKTLLKLAQSQGVHVLVWDEDDLNRFVQDRITPLSALRAGYEQARFEFGGKHA